MQQRCHMTWRNLIGASLLLSACATDAVPDGDVVVNLPGGKSDDSCEWTQEIIDEEIGRSRGQHSTVRIDQDGFAHVAYEDRPLNNDADVAVRYATNRSGAWVTTVVSTTCRLMANELAYMPLGTRSNSNLDLDADGHAYIACSDGHSVMLLDNATGAWRQTDVRTPQQAYDECRSTTSQPGEWGDQECRSKTPAFGRQVALRLDSHGTPHVLYTAFDEEQYSASHEWLELAVKSGDGWTVERVSGAARYLDMMLDARDRVHIVAQQDAGIIDGNVLMYMTNVSGTWTGGGGTLASAYRGEMGHFASGAVSKSGRLHAVHFDNTFYADNEYTAGLVYIRKGNGSPLAYQVKRGGTPRAWAADVALDADENLHVVYHDNGTFVYQRLSGDQMTAPITIDGNGVGSHASIALGGGTIHATYYDEGEARLKFARWTCTR